MIEPGLLISGMLLLEKSPHPLTPQQAKTIYVNFYQGQTGFGMTHPNIRLAAYLLGLMHQLLTQQQKDYLMGQQFVLITEADVSSLESQLQKLSGAPTPRKLITLPAGNFPGQEVLRPDAPQKKADFIEPLVAHFAGMQANPATRLTREQAGMLLPIIHTYRATPTTFNALVLPYLSDEQKAWIDEHMEEIGQLRATHANPGAPRLDEHPMEFERAPDGSPLGLETRLVELLKSRGEVQ